MIGIYILTAVDSNRSTLFFPVKSINFETNYSWVSLWILKLKITEDQISIEISFLNMGSLLALIKHKIRRFEPSLLYKNRKLIWASRFYFHLWCWWGNFFFFEFKVDKKKKIKRENLKKTKQKEFSRIWLDLKNNELLMGKKCNETLKNFASNQIENCYYFPNWTN